MSRPVLPKELVKLHADLPRKSMRRLTAMKRAYWFRHVGHLYTIVYLLAGH